nr:RNA-directed DNA polymerase, eukaryota [Tanacetum cinerariifolium]
MQGKVFWIRAKDWVPKLLEDLDEEELSENESLIGTNKSLEEDKEADNGDMEDVPDTVFVNSTGQKENGSEDPFGIYSILNRNTMRKNDNGDAGTPSYPLGFTPKDDVDLGNEVNEGGSFLSLMEEVVKVGQTMGYNIEGVVNNLSKIIDSHGVSSVNRCIFYLLISKALPKRLKKIGFRSYVLSISDSVGNSGGILCVLDSCSFRKSKHTISDYFVLIRSVWLKSGIDTFIVAVYDPHDLRDKRMVWDYLGTVIKQWKGNVVLIGDFNEVRYKSDRFGSTFNVQGAVEFNYFINDTDLEEVPLGGSMFTRCHKSGLKMSKLDRFFISNSLFNSSPHINVITLERYFSDHRPILLRETNYDYGPIPFWFFHHWFELEGFNKFVIDSWNVVPGDVSNGMLNLVYKLKSLKVRIQEWIKDYTSKCNGAIDRYKEELRVLDEVVDKGQGSDSIANKRVEIINNIFRLEHLHSMDMAQKAKFWSTIENDVFDAVNHFFSCGDIPKGYNSSFIALIPKVTAANLVKDFRPISLIGSVYNNIVKFLTNILVGVLGDIVSEVQSAFIADMQILDGPFILNEVIQWCKSKKKQSLVFKMCLKSSRGSIVINGSPTEEFQYFRGLKQGDPLSPFLFILVMESLHLSFQRVVEAGLFTGLFLSKSFKFSHMFYADDAIFVGQWSDENINTLVRVLDCFHCASGLKINMSKSKIMGIYVEGNKVEQAATKLGYLILTLPFSYLGTKVGGFMSRIQAWKEVVDKIKARLSRWKMKTLSIGGRLTLLKSVLGSLPIFHMSIFKVPSKVLHELESLRGHFFNGHEADSNKASLVKWDSVLVDKDRGIRGVESLCFK